MTPEPRNPALEAAILEGPDDAEGYLVLADWLTSQGHPRGELIALQHRLSAAGGWAVLAEERRLAEELRDELYPRDVDFAAPSWEWGFVRELKIFGSRQQRVPFDRLEEVLRHPSCRFLRRLEVNWHEANADAAALLSAAAPASLREAYFTLYDAPVDLGALAAALPRLRRLTLHVGEVIGADARFPSLELLILYARNNGALLSALAGGDFPHLAELSFFGGGDVAPIATFSAFCASPAFPCLHSLAVGHVPLGPHHIDALLAARWSKGLRRLVLAACLLEPGLRDMVRKSSALRHVADCQVEPRARR